MEIKNLISECTAYDFKLMLEGKRPKSWLKSVSAFANGLGGSCFLALTMMALSKGLITFNTSVKPLAVRSVIIWILFLR